MGLFIRISENLRALRTKERYSLEDVAEIIGVSRQSVAKWESGETLPDIEKCVKLAKLYKVSLDALVNDAVSVMMETNGEDGKYCFGVVKVGEDMRIRLPEELMRVFGISRGDYLLLLGDRSKGIALVKCGGEFGYINDVEDQTI